jgi:hypothetical protein
MPHPHRSTARVAADEPSVSVSNARALRATVQDRQPQRAKPLTRRYEAAWLTPAGTVESSTRLAPAIALFEEAFSALARGTLVLTRTGPVAVEDLVPGMQVLTAEGRCETVTWIGSMTFYPGQDGPDFTTLTRLTAEAFGLNRPSPDLILGPRARLLLRDNRCQAIAGTDEVYVPARAFVDGVSVIEVSPATPVSVYHLALARHGSLRAMGMDVESYHPGGGIEAMIEPRLLALFTALFPHVTCLDEFGPSAHPRLTRFEVDQLIG